MIRVRVRKKGRKFLSLFYVDPGTNREICRSAKTNDAKEAERAAARWEAELLDSRGVDGCGWDYFRERFEGEHLASLAKNSHGAYHCALDHFERIVKLSSVALVTNDHVSIVKGKLLSEGRPASSVTNILTHCRAAFKWAERIGMLRRAPHFTMPRIGKRKLMRGRAINDAEFQKMLTFCHVPYGKERAAEWRRLLELIRLSGLRLEETTIASWDAPPLQVFPDAKPYPHLLYYVEAHKAREDELAPITPPFTKWLRSVPKSARHGLLAPVHGLRGQVLEHDKIGRAITAIGEAAGIVVSAEGKFASAHDLRRAFGREWAQKVKPAVLQRMMRHRSITTTMAFYAHLESEDIGAALWDKVGGEVGGNGTSPDSQRSKKQRKKRRS